MSYASRLGRGAAASSASAGNRKAAPQRGPAPAAATAAPAAVASSSASASIPAATAPVAAAAPAPAPAPAPAVDEAQHKTAPEQDGDDVPSAAATPAHAASAAGADDEVDGDEDELPVDTPISAGAAAAVGDDSIDDAVRHPLENAWTLWYEVSRRQKSKPKGKPKSFAPTRKQVMSFSTVEDFWCLMAHVARPSEIVARDPDTKIDYLLFKTGVEPEWEQCTGGGQWELGMGTDRKDIDDQWEFTLLALIGEQFGDDSSQVLGGAIRLRPRGSRLELWTKTAADSTAIESIGNNFKKLVEINKPISYFSFSTLKSQSKDPSAQLTL